MSDNVYTQIGSQLKKASFDNKALKQKIDCLIRNLSVTSAKDQLSEIIELCLLCEVDCQTLIDAWNMAENESSEVLRMCKLVLCGWTATSELSA